ncbi:Centromere protein L [Balamuthia mandrillaris]
MEKRREEARGLGEALPVQNAEEWSTQELANKTWYTYRLSPMYRFSRRRLSAYAAALSARLQAAEGHSQQVVATILADKQGTGSLLITSVAQREPTSPRAGVGEGSSDSTATNRAILSQAVLSTVGQQVTNHASISSEFVFFPVVLMRGHKQHCSVVQQWLQQQFDCRISSLSFTPYALAKMASLWMSPALLRKIQQSPAAADVPQLAPWVELTYNVPPFVPGLRTIKLSYPTLPFQALCQQATTMLKNDAELEEEGEGRILLKLLADHFQSNFPVSLSVMSLSRIGTMIAYVGAEGRIKILNPMAVRPVLEHLAFLAVAVE